MSFWSSLGSLAGSIFGGIGQSAVNYVSTSKGLKDQYNYNKLLQQQSYGYNKNLQTNAQNWATKMASTAHQLEVNDLRKAGLNPILSATGGSGASAPSASGGSVGSGSVGLPDYDLGEGLSTALQFRQQKNLDKQQKNQDKQTTSLVDLQEAQKGLVNEQEHNAYQEGMNLFKMGDKLDAEVADLYNQIESRNATTAAQVERLRTQNAVDLINADTNRKVGSANAYFNTHRALGFSDSWSDPSYGYNYGIGQVHFGGNRTGISHSRTW